MKRDTATYFYAPCFTACPETKRTKLLAVVRNARAGEAPQVEGA